MSSCSASTGQQATYESIRVGGDWDQLFGNIREVLARREARSSGPEIQVQIIEMDENASEVDRFRDYWLEQGAVVKVRRKLSWGGRLATPSSVLKELRIPCPWAITLMHVLWDGRIPRCAGDTEGDDSACNAWHSSLVELWARLAPHRALHLERRFDELPERCRDCKDWMTGASMRERPQVATRAGDCRRSLHFAAILRGHDGIRHSVQPTVRRREELYYIAQAVTFGNLG
jgi:hypothetical protein